jgi:predicted nucleotidyltransferase
MPPDLPPLVQRTVERLIRAFAPDRIMLFGSCAKGTAQPSSDVDLLVIARLDGNRLIHQRRARQLAADCFPRVDVVFATPEDVAEASTARSPFLLSILGSAITLYSSPVNGAVDVPKDGVLVTGRGDSVG